MICFKCVLENKEITIPVTLASVQFTGVLFAEMYCKAVTLRCGVP